MSRIVFSAFCLALVLVQSVLADNSLPAFKGHESCDVWAQTDGECINNPRFMWSTCLGSCLSVANDVDEACPGWAREGECDANPNYIQLHCPQSCGLAVAWNPWVRQGLNIDPVPNIEPFTPSVVVTDVITAADAMQERLVALMQQYKRSIPGISLLAPSHFLGVVGIAEAFLYIFRLQEVVLKLHGDQDAFQLLREHIAQALTTISQGGFSPDLLSRELPFWIGFAAGISNGIQSTILAANPGLQVPMVEVSKYFSGFIESEATLAEDSQPLSDSLAAPTKAKLNNGLEMPLLGLGTWQLDGEQCYNAVLQALQVGYRSIDTAQAYGNEAEVGRALTEALAQGFIQQRSDVFLASKLSMPEDMGYEKAKALVEKQLNLLQTTYIDLYMLHSPPSTPELEAETWKALEELVAAGKIKSLGVSNYEPRELDRLMDNAAITIKPAVVQNKVDVYHVGKQLDIHGDEIVAYCRQHGLVLVGYSAFSAYPFVMEATHDPIVQYLAQQRSARSDKKVTTAQVIIKWMAQRGIATIPRSTSAERMAENLQALYLAPLTSSELSLLDSLQILVSSPVSVPITIA